MLEMNSYLHVLNRICEEVQQDMANKSKKDNEIDWDVNVEVLFFYAMTGHKPVGVNRHFMMLLIHNKFSAYLNHEISSKAIWDHLDSMYDMAALHESEIIPFPNDEVDFELPEDCHDLLESKYGVSLKRPNGENESTKSNSNSRSSKKFGAPKLKQSSTPVSIPKSNFATPTISKPSKSQAVVKNETKLPNIDVTPKVKQELGSSVKMNKFKHSSSPFSNKPVKYESLTMTKEDSPDTSVSKKNKAERGSSPAITKKPMKSESVSTNNASKKPSKSDSSNGSRVIRVDTPDNYVKKIKTDKELLNKKGKVSSTVDHTPSSKKKENNNGIKKKNESESSMKKSTESSSLKHIKTDVKSSSQSSKAQEIETSSLPGSRKSSPVVKVKSSESSKKVKRSKMEEPKKSTPSLKRRRQ